MPAIPPPSSRKPPPTQAPINTTHPQPPRSHFHRLLFCGGAAFGGLKGGGPIGCWPCHGCIGWFGCMGARVYHRHFVPEGQRLTCYAALPSFARMPKADEVFRSTTIIAVRRDGRAAMAG